MPKYAIGFDPGYRKLGMGYADVTSWNGNSWDGTLTITDLADDGGVIYDLTIDDFGTLIYDYVRSITWLLVDTLYVGIERQPPIADPKIQRIQAHLESVIRALFPTIAIFLVVPQSVRKFWNTQGTSYDDRKKKSKNTSLLSNEDMTRAMIVFKNVRVKEMNVDAIEAMQLCIYVMMNIKTLKHPVISQMPRIYRTITLDAPIHKPKEEQVKKRRRIA